MLSSACRASGAASIAVMLLLGSLAMASAAEVRDFDEIAASDVVITPDPSGRAATLDVDTSVDVACTVVYGIDESCRLIAVDSDMDGGAHTDHSLVLGGLQPGTAHIYRPTSCRTSAWWRRCSASMWRPRPVATPAPSRSWCWLLPARSHAWPGRPRPRA